jgi:hypothetical protein
MSFFQKLSRGLDFAAGAGSGNTRAEKAIERPIVLGYPVGYDSEMKLNTWEAFAVLGLMGALFLILAIMFAGFRFFAGFSLLD